MDTTTHYIFEVIGITDSGAEGALYCFTKYSEALDCSEHLKKQRVNHRIVEHISTFVHAFDEE